MGSFLCGNGGASRCEDVERTATRTPAGWLDGWERHGDPARWVLKKSKPAVRDMRRARQYARTSPETSACVRSTRTCKPDAIDVSASESTTRSPAQPSRRWQSGSLSLLATTRRDDPTHKVTGHPNSCVASERRSASRRFVVARCNTCQRTRVECAQRRTIPLTHRLP